MRALISVLPASWQPYAKGVVSALFTIGTVVSASLPSSPLWLTIALAVLGTAAVAGTVAPGYVAPPVRKDRALGSYVNDDAVPPEDDGWDPAEHPRGPKGRFIKDQADDRP